MKKFLTLVIMFMFVLSITQNVLANGSQTGHNNGNGHTDEVGDANVNSSSESDSLGVGVGFASVDNENTNRNVNTATSESNAEAYQLQGQLQGQVGINSQDQVSVGKVRTNTDVNVNTPVTTDVSTPVDVVVSGDNYTSEDNSVYMPITTSPGKTEIGLTAPGIGGVVLSDDSGPENDILAYLDMVGRHYQAGLLSRETAQAMVAEALPVLWKEAKKSDKRHLLNLFGVFPW